MPAKIYGPPAEIGPVPELKASKDNPRWMQDYWDACAAYEAKIDEWVKKTSAQSDHELVGFHYKYPVGDGYARYVVLNARPLELVHIPTGDAWNIPEVVRRGLNLAELRKEKEMAEARRKMFPQSKDK